MISKTSPPEQKLPPEPEMTKAWTLSSLRAAEKIAAAHEGWIGELLGNISEEEARHLTGMLMSFRSNWEGRE
jgi:hypothetical protein